MSPKQFENEVIVLIELMGFSVIPEFQFGSKKVDFLATRIDDFGKERKYVGECKNYNKPLTKEQLIEIIVDYQVFLDNKYELLIVTKCGLVASAQAYINDRDNISHILHNGLLNSTMNFTLYLQGVYSSESEPVIVGKLSHLWISEKR